MHLDRAIAQLDRSGTEIHPHGDAPDSVKKFKSWAKNSGPDEGSTLEGVPEPLPWKYRGNVEG